MYDAMIHMKEYALIVWFKLFVGGIKIRRSSRGNSHSSKMNIRACIQGVF